MCVDVRGLTVGGGAFWQTWGISYGSFKSRYCCSIWTLGDKEAAISSDLGRPGAYPLTRLRSATAAPFGHSGTEKRLYHQTLAYLLCSFRERDVGQMFNMRRVHAVPPYRMRDLIEVANPNHPHAAPPHGVPGSIEGANSDFGSLFQLDEWDVDSRDTGPVACLRGLCIHFGACLQRAWALIARKRGAVTGARDLVLDEHAGDIPVADEEGGDEETALGGDGRPEQENIPFPVDACQCGGHEGM